METSWGEYFNQTFAPHGHCYLWRTDLLLLHAGSDILIGIAYFSIPLALWVFVKRRKDLAFDWMFMLFAAFIFTCGTTHFLAVWNIWNGDYYTAGAVKAMTAGFSVVTAALLWPLIPKAMALPSPAALQATNARLNFEIDRRHAVEDQLRYAGERLEQRVEARTRELQEAKAALEREVADRRAAERRFRKLFESSPHGTLLIDRAGTIHLANQQALVILGYEPVELEGRSADTIIVPGSSGPSLEQASRMGPEDLALMESCTSDWFGLCRDGRRVPLDVALNSVDPDSSSDIILSIIDVSARVEAEAERGRLMEQLRTAAVDADRNRAQMEAVLESIHDGIAVFDMQGRPIMVNSALTSLHGMPNDSTLQSNLMDLFQAHDLSLLSGQILAREQWPYQRVLRGETIDELEVLCLRRETGQSWCFSFSGAPVYNHRGKQILAVIVGRDITERRQLENARLEMEQRLQLAVSIADIGLWDWTKDTIYYSGQFKRQLGYEEHELGYEDYELGDSLAVWEDRLHPADRTRALAYLNNYVEHPTPEYHLEYRLRHRDGSYRSMISIASPVSVRGGRVERLVGTQLDVTATKQSEERIRQAAQHDSLTGLPNRALIFEHANRLLASARRHGNQVAFLFIDLDRFKPINDLYGHEVGDQLLQQIGKRMATCVRDEDLVGRLGGDEFLVILSQIGEEYPAGAVAQHIIEVMSLPFAIANMDISVSACIGVSLFPHHGNDVDALIHNADLAMYQAKYSGRGNYQLYSSRLQSRAGTSPTIEARIKRALQRDELALHYQPVVSLRDGQIIGAEALLRLTHSDGPWVGPNQFIPVAEASGLISQLGEWVAYEACRQHAEWLKQGLAPMRIAINVSPLQFRQRGFLDRLRNIVDKAGVDPHCFEIEVTESTVMESMDEAVKTLQGLREMGIRVALDDFGTGYSSLSHLSNLPLDKLKVDQSFVAKLEHDRASQAIVEAILALGRTLNLDVVGEGIESATIHDYLRTHGCNQAQGFYISEPLPPSEFAAWHRENRMKFACWN